MRPAARRGLAAAFILLAAVVVAVTFAVQHGLPRERQSFGSELLLAAMLLAAGAALWRDRPYGHLLALGWLGFGAVLGWLTLLITIALAAGLAMAMLGFGGPNLLAVAATLLTYGLVTEKDTGGPATWQLLAAGVVVLLVAGFACRLMRPMVAAGVPPAKHWESRVIAFALLMLAFAIPVRMHPYALEELGGTPVKTRRQLAKEAYEFDLAHLLTAPVVMQGGAGLVFRLSYSVDTLVHVDTASGSARKVEVPGHLMERAESWGRAFSPESRIFWTSEHAFIDVQTAARVQAQVPYAAQAYRPLGYVEGGRVFLVHDPQQARVVFLDTASGAIRREVKVERPPHGLARLSPGGDLLAWSAAGALHTLDTATGEVRSREMPGSQGGFVELAADAPLAATSALRPGEPQYVVTLDQGRAIPFPGDGGAILHFSQARGLFTQRAEAGPPRRFVVARHDAGDAMRVAWRSDLGGRSFPGIDAEGRWLYAIDNDARSLVAADVDTLRGEAAASFQPIAAVKGTQPITDVAYFPRQRLVAIVHSPMATLVRLDAAGRAASTFTVDLTPFALKVETF